MILKKMVGKKVRYCLGKNELYVPSEKVTSEYLELNPTLVIPIKKKEEEKVFEEIRVRFLKNGLVCKRLKIPNTTVPLILYKQCFPLKSSDKYLDLGDEGIVCENYVGFDVVLNQDESIVIYLDLGSEEEVKRLVKQTEFDLD